MSNAKPTYTMDQATSALRARGYRVWTGETETRVYENDRFVTLVTAPGKKFATYITCEGNTSLAKMVRGILDNDRGAVLAARGLT